MKKVKILKLYFYALKRWLKQPYKAKLLNSLRKTVKFNNTLRIIIGLSAILIIVQLFFPIEEAVIATGEITLENSEKELSSSKESIIEEIFIKEGDFVEANQKLIAFDENTALGQINILQSSIESLEAQKIRLQAEKDNEMPKWSSYIDYEIINSEQKLFDSRKEFFDGQIKIADNKILEINDRLQKIVTEKNTLQKQLNLLQENVAIYQELTKQNLESILQLNRAKFQYINAKEEYEAIDIVKKKLEAEKDAMQNQKDAFIAEHYSNINKELIEVIKDLLIQNAELEKAQYIYDKRFLLAPVAGIITDMKYFHPKESIAAAEKILGIIANNDNILITAFVAPRDIEDLKPGLLVRIFLPGDKNKFNIYYYGKVLRVGPNLITNNQGADYYTVDIVMEEQTLIALQKQNLITIGTPVEVHIKINSFGLLWYLISPFINVKF